MLKVEHVNVSYGRTQVLWDLSMHVKKGEILAILGSNGVGKTTLLKTIAGLKRCTAGGRIVYEGHEVQNNPPFKLVEQGIALAPEGRRLFSLMDVKSNLELGAYTRSAREHLNETLGFVYELFPVLREREHQAAESLSGGEQQMLNIARALMCRPRLLLLDEPSAGIAPVIADKIFKTLFELNKSGLTIVLVEQNATRALTFSNRCYVMANGKIILDGQSSELATNDEVRRAYLGV